MKLIKQVFIILGISFMGEVIRELVPLPVPAGIYGLLILLALLCTGVLKVEQISEVSDWMIELMPLFIVPAGVGLLEQWGALRPILFQVSLIMVLSTVLVFAASGMVTQRLMRKKSPDVSSKSDMRKESNK